MRNFRCMGKVTFQCADIFLDKEIDLLALKNLLTVTLEVTDFLTFKIYTRIETN